MKNQTWIKPLWRLPHQNSKIMVLVVGRIIPARFSGFQFLDRDTGTEILGVEKWMFDV